MHLTKFGNSDDEIYFGGVHYLLGLNSSHNCFTITLDELTYSHDFNNCSENIQISVLSPKTLAHGSSVGWIHPPRWHTGTVKSAYHHIATSLSFQTSLLVFHIWIFSPSTVIKPSKQSLNKEHGSCTHLISPLYFSHTNSNKPLLIPYSQYRLRYAVVTKDTQITVASYNKMKSLPLILQKSSVLVLLVKMQHYTHFDLMRSLSVYYPTNTMAGDLTMAGHTAGLSMFWPRSDTCPSY